MNYKLLSEFRSLFEGSRYLHRRSTLGDHVAMQMYEDIYDLHRFNSFNRRVDNNISVLNTTNRRRGIGARRGDGSFGEAVPDSDIIEDDEFSVRRGEIATIEIGVEIKILMKAMMKQIGRVVSDLNEQARQFRSRGGNPICVGVVGINRAPFCVTYEGDRRYSTGERGERNPIDEADEAERRLREFVAPNFDELLILRFEATNEDPFPFSWIGEVDIERDYAASLIRIGRSYEERV